LRFIGLPPSTRLVFLDLCIPANQVGGPGFRSFIDPLVRLSPGRRRGPKTKKIGQDHRGLAPRDGLDRQGWALYPKRKSAPPPITCPGSIEGLLADPVSARQENRQLARLIPDAKANLPLSARRQSGPHSFVTRARKTSSHFGVRKTAGLLDSQFGLKIMEIVNKAFPRYRTMQQKVCGPSFHIGLPSGRSGSD